MDLFATLIVFLCGTILTAEADSRVERRQTAVTSWDGLEDFYSRLKNQIPFTYVTEERLHDEDYAGVIRYEKYSQKSSPEKRPAPSEALREQDFVDKIEICAHIFNSTFFKMRGEEALILPVNAENGAVVSNLRQYNRDTYNQIYPSPSTPEKMSLSWLNPYKLVTVTVGDKKYEEQLFGCVTRKRDYPSQTFSPYMYKGYFISPVYQSDDFALNGRFVFSDDLKLVALAEEPAVQDPQVVETTRSAYCRAGKHESLGVTSNILHTLFKEEKLRLCSVVMNAFSRKVEFQPTEDNVEMDCVERVMSGGSLISVSASTSDVHKEEVRYNDYTIGCKVILGRTGNPFTFYLTRGLEASTVIVWEPSEQVADLYTPVAGVRDVLLVRGVGAIIPVRIIIIEN